MNRTLKVGAAFAGACVAFLASATANAQQLATPGAALNRYEPAERGSEWFASESLDLRGKARPSLGMVIDYGYKPYVLLNSDGSENTAVISDQLYVHLGGGIVLFDRLRLALSLPLALAQAGDSKTIGGKRYVAPSKAAFGDLRIGVDVRLLGEYGDPFTVALGARLWLPTGSDTQYAGDGQARVGPHLAVAGDVGAFVYAARLGVIYRANDQAFNGHPTGTEFDFSAAAGLRVADKKLVIGPEFFGGTVVSNGDAVFGSRTTPLALVVGGHYTAGDFRFGLGAGPGLSSAAGTPAFRALASVDWIPAIVKEAPPPVSAPPPPADRDSDGVLDANDACPDAPGVKTDDPKTNGCPVVSDRDKDGIADKDDACPDVVGVKTDDPKTNGCPPDRDKDGVADKDDACPDVAGVKTDDPKTNGCPSDRDKDGIIDTEDACPEAAGPKDADPKKNGCPAVRIEAGQVKILDQIKFKTGSAEILKVSQSVIDAVAKALKEHPEITHLRVEGHTDNVGKPALNKDLSTRRAASVAKALTKAGVEKGRLSSEGFGSEKPIEDNKTDAGRASNRRVEFHIEDSATKK
jgi:OOP family OmpA-OmpF porin